MSPREQDQIDVLVVGGGFAGLSAGLWLARYRRRTRICDTGNPRNEPTWAVHGYPGIPDLPPHELRHRIRDQAAGAGVELIGDEVVEVTGSKDDFVATLRGGEQVHAQRVLLSFGLRDRLPDVPGLDACYGVSVFHCPDCDGPSMADARVGVIGWDRAAANMALYLLHWAEHVTILCNGREPELDRDARAQLERAGVALRQERVAELEGTGGRLTSVRLEAADAALPMEGLFFHLGVDATSDLARQLGCERDEDGYIRTDRSGETSVAGVYAAGDITGHPHLAISAAADGVRAALTIHRSLLPAERQIQA